MLVRYLHRHHERPGLQPGPGREGQLRQSGPHEGHVAHLVKRALRREAHLCQVLAVLERSLVYYLDGARNFNFLQSGLSKALLQETLDSLAELYALEVSATTKCVIPGVFQRVRKDDAFYGAVLKRSEVFVVSMLIQLSPVFAEYLEPPV